MLSQESLLGQLIPDVYIDGITLETSGEEALVDNPHIEDERENEEKLTSQQSQMKPLKAVIDVSIKEKLDNDLIGEWFREQGFQKYLKIWVVGTTSEKLISLFSQSQKMINFASEGTQGGGWSDEEVQQIFEATGKSTISEAYAYVLQNIHTTVLSASVDSLGGIDAVSSPTVTDSDGNTIKDYVYRVSFNINSQPKNFSVFAVSYLDLKTMKEDYELDFNEGTLDNQNGKVVSEHVIRNSDVVSESIVYMLSEGEDSGKVWTGPVHQPSPGKYMSGSTPLPESKRLDRITVANTKVQDFRQVDEIYKYQIPANDLKEVGFEKNKVILSNDKIYAEENNIHFTDLWLSRDSNGASRFMFGVDVVSLVRHNSLFGNLLMEGSHIVESVASKTKIKNLKVLRKRVKSYRTLNKLGIPVQAEVLFDKKEPYEALIISGSNFSELEEASNNLATVREANPVVSNSPVGMKYYTVHDKQISNITDGLYQYGVEFEIEDGAAKHLEATLSELLQIRRELSEYLLHANKLGMTKQILEINDPHIDDTRERRASGLSSRGHYDPTTNRFTERFIDFCEETYSEDNYPWIEAPVRYNSALADIKGSSEISNFSRTMSKMMAPQSGTPKGIMAVMDLYDKLIAAYNNLVGKSVYSGMRTKASNISFSKTYWFKNDLFDSNVTKMSGFDYLSDIAEKEKSKKRYEDSMPMSEYAELAYGNRQSRGLKMVDGGYWQNRIDTEILKYFRDRNPDLTITTGDKTYTDSPVVSKSSFGFLSPSYVISSGDAYSLTLDREYDYYSKINLGLLESNRTSTVPLDNTTSDTKQTDDEKIEQSRYASIFADLNVTVQPMPSYDSQLPSALDRKVLIDSLGGCEERQLDPVDPYPAWTESSDGSVKTIYSEDEDYKYGYSNSNFVDFFKKTSQFLFDNDSVAGSMPLISSDSINRTIDNFDLNNGNNFLDLIQTNVQKRNAIANSVGAASGSSASEVITQLPIQIKSLVLSKNNSTIPNIVLDSNMDPFIDWKASAKFVLNYEFLASIERFDGFKDDYDNPSAVKSERWVPLTEEYYRQASGKELLCRIKQYNCHAIGIVARKEISAPIYDKYFLLTPPSTLTTQAVSMNIFDVVKQQLLSDWSSALQKISNFATTNLITGAS